VSALPAQCHLLGTNRSTAEGRLTKTQQQVLEPAESRCFGHQGVSRSNRVLSQTCSLLLFLLIAAGTV